MHTEKEQRPKKSPAAQTIASSVGSSPATAQGKQFPQDFGRIAGEHCLRRAKPKLVFFNSGVAFRLASPCGLLAVWLALSSTLGGQGARRGCVHVAQVSKLAPWHELCAPAARSEGSELCLTAWRFSAAERQPARAAQVRLCRGCWELKGSAEWSELDRQRRGGPHFGASAAAPSALSDCAAASFPLLSCSRRRSFKRCGCVCAVRLFAGT